MTTFYISPSCLSYKQYKQLHEATCRFGWTSPWEWPHHCFHHDAFLSKPLFSKAFSGISQSDIFIALVPGTSSTNIEIGAAYTLCEEMILISKDPVYFTQTGLSDAHVSIMPGIKRICCEVHEIPQMLKNEYIYLIDNLSA
jgi:hypothetical protein